MPWGGGGTVTSISMLVDREFDDRTARNTFYGTQTNRDTLTRGETLILILDNGSGSAVLEVWTGVTAPTTYDPLDWKDITATTPDAATIKTLYESNSNTNAFTDLNDSIVSDLSLDGDGTVVSERSWEFPPETVYVSANLGISGAGEALAIYDRAQNLRGYLISYDRVVNDRPSYRSLTAENIDVTIQGLTDTTSGSQTFTQDIVLTANRLITKVYLESTETVSDVTIQLLRNTRLVARATNLSFTADTIKEIEIPQGLFCELGTTLTIDVDGVTLKGTGTGPGFQMFLKIDEFQWTSLDLATMNDLPGGPSGGHPILAVRDTPALATLEAIAQASVDDNTGIWVVANDQIQATEDNVDQTIMIRALKTGQLDANGAEISTSSIQKRGLRLAGGTVVRVFSSTDLRVIFSPMASTGSRYPDSPITGSVLHINSQLLYNSFRNRTGAASPPSGQTWEVRLFQLQLPSAENISITYSDVFCFRNDGAGTLRIRTFQVGTLFSSNQSTQIDLAPGQIICVSPNQSITGGSGLYSVIQFGQATDIVLEDITNNDWYRDEIDSTAANNPISLHARHELTDGLVRDHIRTASFSNNPISLAFQRKNFQDDIARIQWWSIWDPSVPALGTNVSETLANIAGALTYIETNINVGFDFEFNAPDATLTIPAITNDGGNSFRIEVSSALPSFIAVNDTITIAGATNAGNNGTFAIDSIAGDRLLFNITNASGVNESGSGAFTQKAIYCDLVLAAHDLSTYNFNCYQDSARTILSSINSEWFNPDYDGVNSVLAIGYNTDIQTTAAFTRMQDDNNDWYVSLGGPRGQVFYFDNFTGYQNTRYLPLNYEDIHIRTLGTADFYFDIHPDDLPIGERRRYSIYSNELNDNDDVDISVGRQGSVITFDEGITSLSVLNGTNQVIEIYNDGTNSGVRIVQPFEKFIPSARLTNVVTPAEGPIAMSIAEIVVAESQDPNFTLSALTKSGAKDGSDTILLFD